ncbi:MAG: hypothetical protein QOE65_2112 [Solirubrobacteraceae bacterium]|nr:hypothetical protein [Solirubrobacteraceae bacterium]
MSTPPPPAGWYADPQAPGRWRWWDGARWTDDVSTPAVPGALTAADYLVIRAHAGLGNWHATIHDRSLAQVGAVRQTGMDLKVLDSAGALVLDADGGAVAFGGAGRSWTVRDAAGAQLGDLAVTGYMNRRITLTLRDTSGQTAGVLAPIGKVDRDFSVTDAAGKGVARVWRAERDRALLREDETWAAQIARPLPPPLDSLALVAVCTLDAIQHVVVNASHSSSHSAFE